MNSINKFLELQKEQTQESYEKAKKACDDLKGAFEDYLTTDVTSPCERLDPDYQAHLDQNMPDWWEECDKDRFYQRKMGEK